MDDPDSSNPDYFPTYDKLYPKYFGDCRCNCAREIKEIRSAGEKREKEENAYTEKGLRVIKKDGRIVVRVHQVIRDKAGNILSDTMVEHTCLMQEGVIMRMGIRE